MFKTIFLIPCFFLTSLTVYSQDENVPKFVSVRSAFSADVVNGKVNFAKLLLDEQRLEFLELTDEQREQFQYLAKRYFEVRDEIHSTSDKSYLTPSVTEPLDLESMFSEILLPHQMELVNASMYMNFFLENNHAKTHLPKDVLKQNNRRQVENLAKSLDIKPVKAKKILSELKDVREKSAVEIRKILMLEITESIQLLPPAKRDSVKELLGLRAEDGRDQRIRLFDVEKLEDIVKQRKTWIDGKDSNALIAHRTKQNFFTGSEYAQFDFTDEQIAGLRQVFSMRRNPDDPSSPIEFKVNWNKNQSDLDGNQTRLYAEVARILLPAQLEELFVLDRWRVLNKHPFTTLWETNAFRENVRLKTLDKEVFAKKYKSLLLETIEKLRDVQNKRSREVLKSLPADWQSGFAERKK